MHLFLPLATLVAVLALCGLSGQSSEQSNTAQPTSNKATKAAPDRDAVKSEIVSLANDILNASQKGDVTFLARATTDDFESTDIDGKVLNKNQALAEVREEKNIKSWAITEPDLVSFDDRSGVLRYVLTVTAVNGRTVKARTTDTYTRSNGKWLLKSQQMTLLK
jgi:Domain of unknown function (DUF4440)